uniref:DUF4116 domain-containing protein n=1 Tax=Panagrellus redivivus TaxID=6233 RepID=A0A7E4ZQX3_PANRE
MTIHLVDDDVVEEVIVVNKFDPVAFSVQFGVFILALILWAILRFCVYRKLLREDPAGPTNIHIQTNAAIAGQQGDFQARGGQPNQPRVTREEHEKNMERLRAVVGDEEAAKIEKELDAKGLELDADAMDEAMKKAGPDVAKIMMRERCTFKEACKIAAAKNMNEQIMNDPEMRERVRNDPEFQQQCLENGALTKSQLETLQAENTNTGTPTATDATQ